jgi:hypothetical protein
MTTDLEVRKLSIIEFLAELKDEAIIQQIENLLKPRVDIWDELNEDEKASIRKGLEDLKNGKRVEFGEFIAKNRSQPCPLRP